MMTLTLLTYDRRIIDPLLQERPTMSGRLVVEYELGLCAIERPLPPGTDVLYLHFIAKTTRDAFDVKPTDFCSNTVAPDAKYVYYLTPDKRRSWIGTEATARRRHGEISDVLGGLWGIVSR